MFIAGVITIVAAVLTLNSVIADDFIPIPDTPFVGKLPLDGAVSSYDITPLLVARGIDPNEVEEILIYVFFTGLGSGQGQATRAFYQIYTQGSNGDQYKQFMNAVFNQPDTVINSANLWFPYCNLAACASGNLFAQKISTSSQLSRILLAVAEIKSVEYKNLDEAMNAYVQGTDTVFRDIYLIGYST